MIASSASYSRHMRSLFRRVVDPLLPAERFTPADKRIVWVIWVAGLMQGFAQSQATVTLPFTRTGLGLSEGEMSLLLGLARLAAFAALPLGWLGDHRGRRRPLLVAVTLVVVGGAAAGLALDAWQFGVLHGILRTGTAAMSGLAVVLLAEKVSLPIRAYAISFFGASVSLGAGLALITLPLADGSADAWRTPHLLVSVGFLLLPFLIKNVPESEIFFEETQRGHWRELLGGEWARRFWVVLGVGFLSSAFGAIGAGFSTARLIDHVGLSTGEAIWILLGGGTAGGLGFFIGGKMADTIGRRKTTVISLLLALAGGLVLYTSISVPVAATSAMVASFGTFAFVPAAGSHRTELFPTHLRASANTAASNLSLAGSAVGLIIGRYTIDVIGLSQTIYVLGIAMAASAALVLLLPETKGQDLTAVEIPRNG